MRQKTVNDKVYEAICKGFENFPDFLPKSKILKYTTQVPILKAAMKYLPHERILEFGSGNFSTPIFYHNFSELFVSVEDNKEWFNLMLKNFPPKEGFCPTFGDIFYGDMYDKEPYYNDLSKEERKNLKDYYKKIFSTCRDWDFLFLDQRKYGRIAAIEMALRRKKCKVIMYHDAQHASRYKFRIIDKMIDREKKDWYSYRTTYSWTNFIINKDVDFDMEKFIKKIKAEEKIYFDMVLKKNPDEAEYLKTVNFSLVKL